jgi:hypothetical protein
VYGWLTTSHSPVSSTRRSPIRSCIGRMRLVAGDAGSRFFSGRDLAIRVGPSQGSSFSSGPFIPEREDR